MYQVCYTEYQVSFYSWGIGSLLKHCKVQICYDQDCLKVFFLLSTVLNGLKKATFIKKVPISKVERLLKSNF